MTVETVDPLRDDLDDGVAAENAMIGAEFGDDLFQSKKVRPKMTRAQKRANKRSNYHGERPHKQLGTFGEVSLMRAEVERLQAEDHTLVAVRAASEREAPAVGLCFFKRDGLILPTVGATRVWRCRAGCGAVGATRTVPKGCTGGGPQDPYGWTHGKDKDSKKDPPAILLADIV